MTRINSGAPWEDRYGYSRAVVAGPMLFVAEIAHQDEIGRAHKEIFGDVRPVATMVQVSGFAHPDHLIEIEIDAYRRP